VKNRGKLLLDVVSVGIGCGSLIVFKSIDYCAGRGWYLPNSVITGPLVKLFAIICGLGVLIRLIVRLIRDNSSHFAGNELIVRWLCLLIYMVVAYFILNSRFLTFEKGFLETVERRVDPDLLQKWAIERLALHQATNATVQIPSTELPSFVVRIRPSGAPAALISELDGHRFVELVWGGGFGHWGLIIGPPNFEVPEQKGYTILKWKPGIYVDGRR
jgi:hypothetical protein